MSSIIREVIVGDCRLLLADALKITDELVDFDCVATDPPYQLTQGGKNGHGMNGGWMSDYQNNGKPVICDVTWDEVMDLCFQALAKNGDAYVMANDKNINEALNAAADAGFRFHNLLAWDKRTATANRWYMKNLEYIAYLFKGRARVINDPASKQLFRWGQKDETKHPTEKPVALMEHYICNSTAPGEIILDPFMGVGTTGVAAARCGRRFTGVEIDEEYFEIAVQRIKAALRNPTFFNVNFEEQKAVQEELFEGAHG